MSARLGPLSSLLKGSKRYSIKNGKIQRTPTYHRTTVRKGYFITANQSVLPEFELFTGGGGKSAGAGAGDHPSLDNPKRARRVQWIPNQPVDPTYDAVSLIDEVLKNYDYKQVNKVQDKPAEKQRLFNPRKEPDLRTVSPSGERKSEFVSNTVVPSTPSRSEAFRDSYRTIDGKVHYTRAPHTYYEAAHERDICAAVALRSHNGGKGASKAQVQAMIRAWYYCNNKKG